MGMENAIIVTEFPPGYRFSPTNEELVSCYLKNKVFGNKDLLPIQDISDIDSTQLYSKPPWSIVANPGGDREWYFFIHQDEYFYGKRETIRIVGNDIGFWKSIGDENPIYNLDGVVFAFKTSMTFFSGSLPKAKKTHWRMEEYRLPTGCCSNDLEIEECVVGKIIRGRDYTSCF